MRTFEIETLSVNDLAEAGYKESEHRWYLGNAKFPTATVNKHFEHLLGRKFKLLSFDDNYVEVEHLGEEYRLPLRIVKTKIKRYRTRKTIYRDEVIKFNGYQFNFPCDMRRCGIDDAVRVAKWVLKTVGEK